MAAPSGRPIDDPVISRRLEGIDKQIERIMREIMNMPKIPAASGGGIAGVSRCEAWSFGTQSASGQTSIGVTQWGITSLFGTPGAGVTAGSGTYPSLVVATAGWYSFTASWEMSWNTADGTPPTYVSVTAAYSSSPEPGFYEPSVEMAPAVKAPNHEVKAWLAAGPILLPAGGTIDINATWNNLLAGYNRAAHVDVVRWA